jgi:hypothetical protein
MWSKKISHMFDKSPYYSNSLNSLKVGAEVESDTNFCRK